MISTTEQVSNLNGITYTASENIALLPGFETREGVNFTLNIAPLNLTPNFEWQYRIPDHLGNTRVIFADKDGDGSIRQTADNQTNEVLGFYNYGTFGLELGGSHLNTQNIDNRYTYNGKEKSDFSNWLAYGARWYDAAIPRWNAVDPLADIPENISWSPYAYVWNNPIINIDPDGRSGQTTIVGNNGDGTFTVKDWIDDGKTDVVLDDGTKVGESLTTHSFVNEHNVPVVGAVIDTRSSEGQDFIDNEIIRDDPNVFYYKDNAKLNQHFDFKSRDLKEGATERGALVHRTRGSMTSDGKMASARDFGNMAAGIVAARAGVPDWYAKRKFNQLQGGQEPPVSAKAQQIGLDMGSRLRLRDLFIKEFKANPWPKGANKY